MRHGVVRLIEVLEAAQPLPIEGLHSFMDFKQVRGLGVWKDVECVVCCGPGCHF